jgi:hypothetical protein
MDVERAIADLVEILDAGGKVDSRQPTAAWGDRQVTNYQAAFLRVGSADATARSDGGFG